MTDSSPALELYNLRGCPYCAKVRRALDDLDLSYKTHQVPRSRSDRDAVHAASGQRGVPVLVDRSNGIEGMPESDDIVEYLYEEYGDGETPPPSGIFDRVLSKLL
ncbi:glutathione S-transferase N-terminal domain-containing protein [Natranaeroarchaeum sulfidigenes]|uniref:Glutaredoxin n=1 Tax=Natranaeroarchaeum sulfidigenes TaxID=2784880 RepID=A0A897MMX7_9EURY|nr:glutathione S-transferase N-terminal domain-containing protein [Natranaeroarchaeum sulfidigenes]QSG01927.1 Glutaredoxin [Natranaeroarchaeum sulfidigenes]